MSHDIGILVPSTISDKCIINLFRARRLSAKSQGVMLDLENAKHRASAKNGNSAADLLLQTVCTVL